MLDSCLKKQETIIELFSRCCSKEEVYEKIIELGKNAPPLDPKDKIPENLVFGCQSTVYLQSHWKGDVIIFQAESDALISSGLASLLTFVYSGESPKTILTCPPKYLDELDIPASLTPSRANGLSSIHLRMKQDALHLLMVTR
ncbi:MAG: SufE family protein [Waddliaceae bacterium]